VRDLFFTTLLVTLINSLTFFVNFLSISFKVDFSQIYLLIANVRADLSDSRFMINSFTFVV